MPTIERHRSEGASDRVPTSCRQEIGATGLPVGELGFGAAAIGNLYRAVDSETASAAIEAAWQRGVRYFDTAPHYGLGLSERRLGEALQVHPRREYVLSTKVGRLLVPNSTPAGSDLVDGGFAVPDVMRRVRDYSRDGVRRSLDDSLRRLKTDRVDVVYVHDPEDQMDQALDEAFPALVDLRGQGVIGAVGAGMNFVDPLRRIGSDADVDVIVAAGRYTLLDRSAATLFDECLRRGVSVISAAPFNSGLLARTWPSEDAHYDYHAVPSETLTLARRMALVCRAHDVDLPHAAIRFPLTHPAVASVVTGQRTASQVRRCVDWMATPIGEGVWADLDAALR